MKKKIVTVAAVAAILVVLVVYGFVRANRQNAAVLTSDQLNEETGSEMTSEIMVHVAGAVINPGVYTLKSDARVIDAIEAAGGVTEAADQDALNLAATVSDGEKIFVYTYEETASGGSVSQSGGLVNINTASKEELMTLSGIGEVLAQNIITYREENGCFKSKEELKEVNRIGDKLYEQIEGQVTI